MTEEIIETTESSSGNKKSGKGPIFWFMILAAVLVVVFLVYKTLPGSSEGVAATINGQKIMVSQIESRYSASLELFKQGGLDPNNAEAVKEAKLKILDSIIGETLFLEKAESEGVSVSDTDVDNFYNNTVQQFGSEQELANQLIQSGINKESFKEDIRKQLIAQKYIEQISANEGKSIETTAQEAKAFYDDYKKTDADVPPYETVEKDILEHLKQQKLNGLITGIIDSLKTEAKIEKFI